MTSACRIRWVHGLTLAAVLLPTVGLHDTRANDAAPAAANNSEPRSVDLFDGMKSGDLDVKFLPKNSRDAQILVKNNTDQPLSVKLPPAFAAVPVLAQAAGAGGGARARGGGGNQAVGGGTNQMQPLGGRGGAGGGGGAFDVAPRKS